MTIEPYWRGYTQSAFHGMDKDGEPIFRDVNVYVCSKCGRRTIVRENYCPSCGSKMKKERNKA